MSDVSHRGDPEEAAASPSVDARLDAIQTEIDATQVDLDVAEAAIDALEAQNVVQATVNSTLDAAITTLQSNVTSGDAALDARLDLIEANDYVTNARLANMAAATIKGSVAGGDPADLTATQATSILNAANATTKGLVPTPPNNTTTFLRGDASFAAPKRTVILWYGGTVVTAGTTDVFANPVGHAQSPLNTTARPYPCPVTGTIVGIHYHVNTAHTTNTVTVEARIAGTPTAVGPFSVAAGTTDQYTAVSPGVAVTRGDTVSCQIDHNGATNLANLSVGFEIEF